MGVLGIKLGYFEVDDHRYALPKNGDIFYAYLSSFNALNG